MALDRTKLILEASGAPPRVDEVTEDGRFLCSATLRHPDALFATRFEVFEYGDVDVIEERVLATFPVAH